MGMSVFKKVARSVGISRWPFRKRQSVREIIEMIDKHLVRLGTVILADLIFRSRTDVSGWPQKR